MYMWNRQCSPGWRCVLYFTCYLNSLSLRAPWNGERHSPLPWFWLDCCIYCFTLYHVFPRFCLTFRALLNVCSPRMLCWSIYPFPFVVQSDLDLSIQTFSLGALDLESRAGCGVFWRPIRGVSCGSDCSLT